MGMKEASGMQLRYSPKRLSHLPVLAAQLQSYYHTYHRNFTTGISYPYAELGV